MDRLPISNFATGEPKRRAARISFSGNSASQRQYFEEEHFEQGTPP